LAREKPQEGLVDHRSSPTGGVTEGKGRNLEITTTRGKKKRKGKRRRHYRDQRSVATAMVNTGQRGKGGDRSNFLNAQQPSGGKLFSGLSEKK